MAIQLVSQTSSCRESIVHGNVVRIFKTFLVGLNDFARYEMSVSLNQLSSKRECRIPLVEQGAVDLLVVLSHSEFNDTQIQCSEALGHLSESTRVKNGTVASLLLLSLKSEEAREANMHQQVTNHRRASAGYAGDPGEAISTHPSVQAKEIAAMQNVKSLKVMLIDGLQRKVGIKHNITLDAGDDSESEVSVDEFTGISLQDYNTCECPPLTSAEESIIALDYSSLQYVITTQTSPVEAGGMSKKVRVDLPYPSVTIHDIDKADRSALLTDVPISADSLPKNLTENRVKELIRYASTNIIENADDDESNRKWVDMTNTQIDDAIKKAREKPSKSTRDLPSLRVDSN
jgi:hypothetical protein